MYEHGSSSLSRNNKMAGQKLSLMRASIFLPDVLTKLHAVGRYSGPEALPVKNKECFQENFAFGPKSERREKLSGKYKKGKKSTLLQRWENLNVFLQCSR
jgi:hypothetical protein